MPTVDRRTPLPGLTALRFFAATYVLLFHFLPRAAANTFFANSLNRVLDAGFTGVSAFFILSGFILAYTHERVPNLGRFFRARFARVYPLYLFSFLWALEPFLRDLLLFHRWVHLWALPADILLLQDWFPNLAMDVNAAAWTLSCEAFFYLLFPFLVTRLARLRRHPVWWIAVFWLLQLLPPILTNTWLSRFHPQWADLAHGLLFTPIGRLGEFLAGMVLGLYFLDRQRSDSQKLHAPTGWLLPCSLIVCLAFLLLNGRVPHEVMRNGLLLGPFALLIWSLAHTRSGLLASRPLQIGGEISYGVYLLQMPYSNTLALFVVHLPALFHIYPLWLLTIYPSAWLTYTFLEKPCRSLLLDRAPSTQDRPIPTPQPDLS